MPVHKSGLVLGADLIFGATDDWHVILINHTSSFDKNSDIVDILRYECIQVTNGYEPELFDYTVGSTTYSTLNSRAEVPDFDAKFRAPSGGTLYSFTHWAMIYGRGANANKPITAINTGTGVFTCTGHGLTNGDKVIITGSGSQPGGVAVQIYYAKSLTSSTFEIYTTSGLTTKVTPTSAGTGTIHLRYANGSIGPFNSSIGSVAPGQEITIRINNYF